MTLIKLLDLKSVPCPLNVVKIRLALENLSQNDQLVVLLDKGEAEEMVQKTLKDMRYCFKKIEEEKNSIKIKIFNDYR